MKLFNDLIISNMNDQSNLTIANNSFYNIISTNSLFRFYQVNSALGSIFIQDNYVTNSVFDSLTTITSKSAYLKNNTIVN
jgi:hypothetical protein